MTDEATGTVGAVETSGVESTEAAESVDVDVSEYEYQEPKTPEQEAAEAAEAAKKAEESKKEERRKKWQEYGGRLSNVAKKERELERRARELDMTKNEYEAYRNKATSAEQTLNKIQQLRDEDPRELFRVLGIREEHLDKYLTGEKFTPEQQEAKKVATRLQELEQHLAQLKEEREHQRMSEIRQSFVPHILRAAEELGENSFFAFLAKEMPEEATTLIENHSKLASKQQGRIVRFDESAKHLEKAWTKLLDSCRPYLEKRWGLAGTKPVAGTNKTVTGKLAASPPPPPKKKGPVDVSPQGVMARLANMFDEQE